MISNKKIFKNHFHKVPVVSTAIREWNYPAKVEKILPSLKNGAFAENITTRGLDLMLLKIGDRLQAGDQVILEITQIGQECYNAGCAIKKATGDCIMPREGLFARVIQGGEAKAGYPIVI